MRRIRRDLKHEEFIDELKGGEEPLFRDLWRVMLFAATLGSRAQRRVKIERYDSGKAMPTSYYGNSPAWPGVLYLLGLVETSATDVLASNPDAEETLLEVFEEYANGGLYIMRERMAETPDKLKAMMDLLDEYGEDIEPIEPDLGGVTI